jgi:hypothetical protein
VLHQSAAYVVGTDPNTLPHCAASATGAAGLVAPVGEDCSLSGGQFCRPSSGCFRPALVAGLGISGFWVRQAPCGTPRIGAVVEPATPVRVDPRADRCGSGEPGVQRWRRGLWPTGGKGTTARVVPHAWRRDWRRGVWSDAAGGGMGAAAGARKRGYGTSPLRRSVRRRRQRVPRARSEPRRRSR